MNDTQFFKDNSGQVVCTLGKGEVGWGKMGKVASKVELSSS